jgi:hypothetical protein
MKILQTKLYVILFIGTLVLIVSACASPPLEVFLSPNPSFQESTSPSVAPQNREEPVYQPFSPTPVITVQRSTSRPAEDKIVLQLSETLGEAEAHVHAGEARLQEQNLLEAAQEFEQARTLIEEGVNPALQYIQQAAQTQGGVNILSEQRVQNIRTQRVELLSRINRAYDFQTMYAKQRESDRVRALREENKVMLRPVNIPQTSSSRVFLEPRPKVQPFSGSLNLAQIVSSDDINRFIVRFQQRHNEFRACLERANQYFPTVTSILSAYGVPDVLAYVALIESGFQPSVESSSGKTGLWQLSRAVAQSYGLKVNSYNDERKAIEASTRTFAQYISNLYRKFGSWELAILGYEIGEQNLQNTISRVGSANLQDIQRYSGGYTREGELLSKLAAAITIANNPKAYGFDIELPNISGQITAQGNKSSFSVMTEPPAATLY